MSSALRLLMNRLFLSAAVKKMLVRLVSNLTTSSESCGNSSRVRGVGDGDGDGDGDANALGATPVSFFADILRVAMLPHTTTNTKSSNRIGRPISRYCILLPNIPMASRCQRSPCILASFAPLDLLVVLKA